jgi:hypothetical protein
VANNGAALTKEKDVLVVVFSITAKKTAINVCCGFQIKNAAGELITGINTQMLKQKLTDMKAGEIRTYEWSIQNIFAEGSHSLSLAVEANDKTADWVDDAAIVDVLLEQRTPFIVNPRISIQELQN